MYQDIEISKGLNEKFRQIDSTSDTPLMIDFRIKILSHGSWPLDQGVKCTLPEVLLRSIDRFTGFYNSKFSGRKLMWLHKLSKAEIGMRGKSSRLYFIKVSFSFWTFSVNGKY